MGIAGDIALILVACLVCAVVAQRLGLPLILGYIVAGILVGPGTAGPTVEHIHEIELLADIGVALLLFTVGLEFPAEKMRAVRGISFVGAPLQMALVTGWGYLLGRFLGWSSTEAIWFGALISISSTMVVLKILMSRGLMETLSSKVMLGILVVQDLAVVPLMILLPALGNLETGLLTLGLALLNALVFLGLMAVFGTRLLPWFLERVVGWKSRELFIVVVAGLGLGIGYGTYLVGLSFAFGAFLAGIVLSRSAYSHDALSDMIPLREVFSLLFFASVGLLLSPEFLLEHAFSVLGLVLAILLGKGLMMALVTRLFGYRKIIPLAIALSMSQVGEFSFVLARVGRESGGLSESVYFHLVSVAVVTMALTPFSSAPVYRLYQWWIGQQPIEQEEPTLPSARGRVVMIGFGRHGQLIAGVLKEVEHPPLILERDFDLARRAREADYEACCADINSEEVFDKLAVSSASLIILASPDTFTGRTLAERLAPIKDGPAIVAVAEGSEYFDELLARGIASAVLAPLETGLEMAHQALLSLDFDEVEAHAVVDSVRRNHYHAEPAVMKCEALTGLRMGWVELGDREGRLDQLSIRTETGASVVAVIRQGELIAETGAAFTLEKGDRVAVVGSREARRAFKDWAQGEVDTDDPA